MLILTRKEGESLRLGDDITVTVVSVKGGNVRVGITAPRELAVHREEIYQKISESEGKAEGRAEDKTEGNSSSAAESSDEDSPQGS